MRDYNKVKPLSRSLKPRTYNIIRRLPAFRYWILLFIILIGFSMHLTSQVWRNNIYQKLPLPTVLNDMDQTQIPTTTVFRGQIHHSFYHTLRSAGLSAKQALQLQRYFSPYVNYRALKTNDSFQVMTNHANQITAASLQTDQKRYILFRDKHHAIQFIAQSTIRNDDNFNIKDFYIAHHKQRPIKHFALTHKSPI